MISPIKTLIANLTDRPARLYLRGRNLCVIPPKGMPGSIAEVEGDVFSRIENTVEAEFFLEQILNGQLTVSYSIDERFVCSGCVDNTNMNLPAKFIDKYRGIKQKPVQEIKQEFDQKIEQKSVNKPTPKINEKSEEEPTQKIEQEPVQDDSTDQNKEPNQEPDIEDREEATTEKTNKEETNKEETLSDIVNKNTDTTEDKPKKTRKIKVQ